MEYVELNYVSYEHIFVDNCIGSVITGLDKPHIVKANAQNVDWYILLPAIMSEEERLEYLGADYQKITKDTLNAMRKGRTRRDYIDALFWKKDAVDIVKAHFLEKVPLAIVGPYRRRIVEQLWTVISMDILIPEKRRIDFENKKKAAILEIETNDGLNMFEEEQYDALCLFLAETFVFAMNREKLLNDELHLSHIVIQVVKDLQKGKTAFLDPLLDSMINAMTVGEPDENNNRIMKDRNDSQYTDDDYRFICLTLKELYPFLTPEQIEKIRGISVFAMTLDQKRLHKDLGRNCEDELIKKYGFNKRDFSVFTIDPNVDYAVFYFTQGDGRKYKVEMRKNPDGTYVTKIIGEESGEESESF